MDTYTIDSELEHYYGDRMTTTNKDACRRFYLRAVSRFNGPELDKYLSRVKSYAGAYASFSKKLQSPMMHVELPLFLSSLVLAVASLVMVANGETSVLLAAGVSAGVVGMLECLKKLTRNWLDYSIREAVFRELAESLVQEKNEPSGTV